MEKYIYFAYQLLPVLASVLKFSAFAEKPDDKLAILPVVEGISNPLFFSSLIRSSTTEFFTAS